MKKIEEIGICPNCECSLSIFKSSNYKRFVKCEICGLSYPLPKSGKISNSALVCPINKFPLLIIEKVNQQAYFWTETPCFNCFNIDRCNITKELISEFKDLKVYGY